jgi:hypothetical protein
MKAAIEPIEDEAQLIRKVNFEPADFQLSLMLMGPSVTVYVGADGAVQSVSYRWHSLEPIGEYPLVSEAEALERLHRCDGHFVDSSHELPSTVDEVSLEYVGLPIEPPYDYLVPVYYFTDRPPEGEFHETHGWIPAIVDEYLEPLPPQPTATQGSER